MIESYGYLMKFIIVGNAATGKTCLLRWFLDRKFKEDSMHTIGVEFGTKIVQIEGKSIKLQIWDTAGQERFQCVTRAYYRGAVGALIVYDINDRESFNAVRTWSDAVRNTALHGVTIILVGNKSDLAESRQVSESEGRQYAEENGFYTFLETSAKNGRNVDEAFISVARSILAKGFLDRQVDQFPIGTTPSSSSGLPQLSSQTNRCC